MLGIQNENQRQRVKAVQTSSESYSKHIQANVDIWSKQLGLLEKSLTTMRDELFQKDGHEELTITGQCLVTNAAERAAKLVKEAAASHRTSHVNCSKIGKSIDRHFEKQPLSVFKLECNMTKKTSARSHCCSMIFDMITADGFEESGEYLKQEAELTKYDEIEETDELKDPVVDVRDGDIQAALDMITKAHPQDEDIRTNLQTQMITDCIEIDHHERALDQMKMFREGWMDEKDDDKGLRFIGALMVGRQAMSDCRYRDLFDYAQREQLSLKLAAYFMPCDSPLKMILRYGAQALMQLSVLGKSGNSGCFYVENELPMEVSINPTHSAFTCPILKEQCSTKNPPMRLICGHVISKDAINRLTTSLRQVRSNRNSRFKCPYCPREQYMENAKVVSFGKWSPDDEEDQDDDIIILPPPPGR